MSKNIREILKNKFVISGVTISAATAIAIGLATNKKNIPHEKVQNQVAQVEEITQKEVEATNQKEKETKENIEENQIKSNLIENAKDVKNAKKSNIKSLTKKSIIKPIVKKDIKLTSNHLTPVKKSPVKLVDTKNEQELLNQRDKLEKEVINNSNEKLQDKNQIKNTNLNKDLKEDNKKNSEDLLNNKNEIKENENKCQDITIINELDDKLKNKREQFKANALKHLDIIKNMTPKSKQEIAKVSNNVINAMENAKAYNEMVLADKKSTEEMKKEATSILERAKKELNKITLLTEAISANSKDLTWSEYLGNLYNYASGELTKVYEYVVDETNKSYKDIVDSANKVYTVSKNAYDTAKYTYNNFDNVKTASKDLSEVSGVIGAFNKDSAKFLNNVNSFVKDYKPSDSYITIAKERVNSVTNLLKDNLTADNVATASNLLVDKNKKNSSIISPVTNIVNNVADFTNTKVNKIKTTVSLSNTYVATKNVTKNLYNGFWGLLGSK